MPEFPEVLIDMHTHLFNARYVPLKEILISKGVPKATAGLLARLILDLTGKSRDADLNKASFKNLSHEEIIDGIISNIAALALDELTALAVGATNATRIKGEGEREWMAEETLSRMEESDLYKVAVEINRLYGDVGQDAEAETEALMRALSEGLAQEEAMLSRNVRGVFSSFPSHLKRFIASALNTVEHSEDFMEFLWTMLLREEHIVQRLKSNYGRHAGVDLVVHHMMDMDHPFDGTSTYPFYTEQLNRMMQLERDAQGELLGFAAFDPTRCVNEGLSDSAIEELLATSLNHGKRGFKFYPPMGFKAAGNDNQPRIEHAIDIFLDYCVDHHLPVFTHCTPEGFEQTPGAGMNAHPRHWEVALTKKESRKNLILCFGHAGGGHREITENGIKKKLHGWLADPDVPAQWTDENNYARWVVELCTQFPNVYGELSYFHEIIDSPVDNKNLQFNLVREYQRTRDAFERGELSSPLEDKLMYGSDWHMPSMVNEVDDYLKFIVNIFHGEQLAPVADKFFFKNAVRYLRLAEFIPTARDKFGDSFADRLQTLVSVAS